jgi:hypothetical protein
LTRTWRDLAFCAAIFSSLLLGGCASLNAELQGIDYPADTAILIGQIAYQINTTKCAQIRSIAKDGTLDCYDTDGKQSASITPVSDFRKNLVQNHHGMTWASAEHQAFLFDFFHGGGKERAAAAIVGSAQQAYGAYASTKSMLDSIDKSKAIDARSAQLKADGAAAYMSGMPAWQAHQSKVLQWRVENAKYFVDQMNKTTLIGIQ